MTLDDYQKYANRTCNLGLDKQQTLRHALFEMCSELGEIHSFYQKQYQGHKIDEHDLKLEVGDLMWGIAEFCYANGWTMEEIAEMNIIKLQKRYPEGFTTERSVHREE